MWRRWGTGEEGTWLSFHPTGAERFALLSATENETEEKREGKVAIVPNIESLELEAKVHSTIRPSHSRSRKSRQGSRRIPPAVRRGMVSLHTTMAERGWCSCM